jgi:hypothetical protein
MECTEPLGYTKSNTNGVRNLLLVYLYCGKLKGSDCSCLPAEILQKQAAPFFYEYAGLTGPAAAAGQGRDRHTVAPTHKSTARLQEQSSKIRVQLDGHRPAHTSKARLKKQSTKIRGLFG